MCGPLGVVLSAVSTVGSTMAAMGQADAESQVAQRNAELAKQQQQAAAKRGADEAAMLDRDKNQVEGMQRAQMGASGVDASAGSGLSILTDTAYLSQEDKSASQYNTELETWRYGAQAEQYKADAANAKKAKRLSMFTGLTQLGGTIADYRATKRSKKP